MWRSGVRSRAITAKSYGVWQQSHARHTNAACESLRLDVSPSADSQSRLNLNSVAAFLRKSQSPLLNDYRSGRNGNQVAQQRRAPPTVPTPPQFPSAQFTRSLSPRPTLNLGTQTMDPQQSSTKLPAFGQIKEVFPMGTARSEALLQKLSSVSGLSVPPTDPSAAKSEARPQPKLATLSLKKLTSAGWSTLTSTQDPAPLEDGEQRLLEIESVAAKIRENYVERERRRYRLRMTPYALSGNVETIRNLFQMMEKNGLDPNVFHYNALIIALRRSNETASIPGVLDEMKRKNVTLDLFCYNNLLGCFGEKGDIENGEKVLNEMIGEGINPDSFTFFSVIRLYSIARYFLNLPSFLRLMHDKRLTPDARCIHSLRTFDSVNESVEDIKARAKNGTSAWKLMCSRAFSCLLRLGLMEETLELFSFVIERQIPLTPADALILLEMFTANDLIHEAVLLREYVYRMNTLAPELFDPHFIELVGYSRGCEAATYFFKVAMENMSEQPDAVEKMIPLCMSILDVGRHFGNMVLVLKTFEIMESFNVTIGSATKMDILDETNIARLEIIEDFERNQQRLDSGIPAGVSAPVHYGASDKELDWVEPEGDLIAELPVISALSAEEEDGFTSFDEEEGTKVAEVGSDLDSDLEIHSSEEDASVVAGV